MTFDEIKAKVYAQRAAQLARQEADDDKHGRSRFPELEPDGADAFAHGYALDTCPYANTAPTDGAGMPAPLPTDAIGKAASWRRGWLRAQAHAVAQADRAKTIKPAQVADLGPLFDETTRNQPELF